MTRPVLLHLACRTLLVLAGVCAAVIVLTDANPLWAVALIACLVGSLVADLRALELAELERDRQVLREARTRRVRANTGEAR